MQEEEEKEAVDVRFRLLREPEDPMRAMGLAGDESVEVKKKSGEQHRLIVGSEDAVARLNEPQIEEMVVRDVAVGH